jgi:hypothetical protein
MHGVRKSDVVSESESSNVILESQKKHFETRDIYQNILHNLLCKQTTREIYFSDICHLVSRVLEARRT